jgi:hypothetical protein
MTEQSVENIFGRAWDLLMKNPAILLPGLIVGLIVGILTGLLALPPIDTSDPTAVSHLDLAARGLNAALLVAISTLATIVNNAYTIGMSGAAWMRGTARLSDGATAFRLEGGKLFVAIVLLFIIEAVLTIVTFGIGALIFEFFALYVFAATVIGNDNFGRALRESFAISTRRFIPTIVIIISLFVVAIVVGVATIPLRFIPFIGPIVAAIVLQGVVSLFNLVIVGEYLNARNAPDVVAAE